MLEKLFHLKENHTTVRTEIVAGLTTFVTMAYILAVNPSILSATGMNAQGVTVATALASCVGCLAMALLANYPFALAPGMGINAYFAYTVCIKMGYSWQIALFAVLIEGILFIILSVTSAREAIFNAIPLSLKHGASVGVGLFIAFIGLQNAGIVVHDDSTLLSFVDFRTDFHTAGICALLGLIGVVIIAVLYVYKVRGAVLLGIVATWILGIICELTGLYTVDIDAGYYSVIPTSFFSVDFSGFTGLFGQALRPNLDGVSVLEFIMVIFALLYVDLFDTLGALIGMSAKAGMLDEEGRLPRIKQALLADAIATTAGAVLGTSTTTTYAESSAGISSGGRTGLTAITTGFMFILALFFAPLFITIPSFATAPALIFVGFLMISIIVKVDFEDWISAIPAYLTMLMIPLTYSISDGLAIGIISYVLIHVFCGKAKKVTVLMYILAILFMLKYIFL
jgi:AGZA family xanthine/uracil permease-like MFS transporter